MTLSDLLYMDNEHFVKEPRSHACTIEVDGRTVCRLGVSVAAVERQPAEVNGFGLTAGNVNTIWELNPVTNPFTICEFAVSCNASVSSLPVQIDLYTSASVGSSAGNSASVRSLGSTTTTRSEEHTSELQS